MSTSIFEPARKLIEGYWNTSWGVRTPIKWENVPFDQPDNSQFVAFFIRWGASTLVSTGPVGFRQERHVGVIIVMIFTPVMAGQNTILGHCDFAANALRLKQLTDAVAGIDVQLGNPFVVDGPLKDEMIQKNVNVPFQLDSLF